MHQILMRRQLEVMVVVEENPLLKAESQSMRQRVFVWKARAQIKRQFVKCDQSNILPRRLARVKAKVKYIGPSVPVATEVLVPVRTNIPYMIMIRSQKIKMYSPIKQLQYEYYYPFLLSNLLDTHNQTIIRLFFPIIFYIHSEFSPLLTISSNKDKLKSQYDPLRFLLKVPKRNQCHHREMIDDKKIPTIEILIMRLHRYVILSILGGKQPLSLSAKAYLRNQINCQPQPAYTYPILTNSCLSWKAKIQERTVLMTYKKYQLSDKAFI